MGFSRQEYWSRLPWPPPGDLPDSGVEPASSALAGAFFTTEPQGKPPNYVYTHGKQSNRVLGSSGAAGARRVSLAWPLPGLHRLAVPLPHPGHLPGSAWRSPRPGPGVTGLKRRVLATGQPLPPSPRVFMLVFLSFHTHPVIFTPCLPPLARHLQNTGRRPFLPASRSSCSKATGNAFCPDHCVPPAFTLGALGVESRSCTQCLDYACGHRRPWRVAGAFSPPGPASRALILPGHCGSGARVRSSLGGLCSRERPTAFLRFSEGSEGPGWRIYLSKLWGWPSSGAWPEPLPRPLPAADSGPGCPACLHLCWGLMRAHGRDSIHSGWPLGCRSAGPRLRQWNHQESLQVGFWGPRDRLTRWPWERA